ncbi:MAG: zinc-dependent alcohol dehydrogenase family protein [Gammaproteobacteria bacterium]|nr:zinc-dependent alcohol dehydrogenase family protein [Gammaproteobacteria bacterium]MDE2346709.1 zinc-dependent alcohol dehydrogenase family protein [Gammaproteobacteria bacterium]
MTAMVLERRGLPLVQRQLPVPRPGPGEVLLKVLACGVCRTDLHIIDGELSGGKLPLIPGHEIVGSVAEMGAGVSGFKSGDRLGVPWLAGSCGECAYCRSGRENLCEQARFTGYDRDGGYAEYTLADYRYCLRLPPEYDDVHAAPLLCAGLIGYRALRLAGEAAVLGLYGFGAAAHVLAQILVAQGRRVYAFTRPGDTASQEFARQLGAQWAGAADEMPPESLEAALIFAPVGSLVPAALRAVARGGSVVCAGIHMSEIPAFPYEILWGERVLRSVANLTRADGAEFMRALARWPVHTSVKVFALTDANAALAALRAGKLNGAAVLVPQA